MDGRRVAKLIKWWMRIDWVDGNVSLDSALWGGWIEDQSCQGWIEELL